jgi:uncharacterized protein
VIFVDTSYWIAAATKNDAHHDEARRLARSADALLVTSNHVRGETWMFLNRRHGHGSAVAFLDSTSRALRLRIEFVSTQLEDEAWRWLRDRGEREYSFVDATSFAVMRSLRIREALAFDGDFAAAGFSELRL